MSARPCANPARIERAALRPLRQPAQEPAATSPVKRDGGGETSSSPPMRVFARGRWIGACAETEGAQGGAQSS